MSTREEGPTEADDDGDDVVVYELGDWTAEQRGALETRLVAEGVEHGWEAPGGDDVMPGYEGGQPWEVGCDLVVGEIDEERVDALLDEIEFPDELEAVDDDGEVDEAVYSVMGDLYVAADRLKDDPTDLARAGALFDAADAARTLEAPPYGVDPDVWRRVQELASSVTEALESEADDGEVAGRAGALRDLLFRYV